MISRSTLIGALVVVELAIVGLGAKAIAGGNVSLGSHARTAHGPTTVALDRTFATGPAPHVMIDARDVEVSVEAEPGVAVRVVETLRKSGYVTGDIAALRATQTADGVRIAANGDSSVFVVGIFDRRLRVVVPPAAHVEFTSAGRVDASGLRAKLAAHLIEGRIFVRDHRGDVDVSTGTGSIRLVDVQGSDIAASTRDGRVFLTRIGADRIDASSASGRIVGADVRATNGVLTTRDGRITISFTGNSDAVVTARSADGRVRVCGFTTTENEDQRSVVRLGSGRGHFEVSTGSGPITITQGASV